jgi:hypothetical protein
VAIGGRGINRTAVGMAGEDNGAAELLIEVYLKAQ